RWSGLSPRSAGRFSTSRSRDLLRRPAMAGQGGRAAPTRAAKTKWAIGAGLVVVAGVVAGVWWLFMAGAAERSVAHAPLPAGGDAVARIDLESLREVGPIAEHGMGALDETAKKSEDAGKMARFFLAAGLDPRRDLTEAALCATGL